MPEHQRRDLLGECNADAHPIDTFTTECCANCFNPDCTRSLSGKLRFDQRVSTWYERYFGDRSAMSPGDPRFPRIAGQKFLMLDPGLVGRPHEVGGWVDPRDLEEYTSAPPVQSAVTIPTDHPKPTVNVPRELPRQLLLANSPRASAQMIQPSSAPSAAPVQKDAWAAPVPVPASDVPVIQPGARVKLGGSV